MTRDEQLLLIRRDAPLALNRVQAMIGSHFNEILAQTVSRVDAGYDVYGVDGWRKTPYDLDQDTIEELADAVAYQVMRRHRQRHPE